MSPNLTFISNKDNILTFYLLLLNFVFQCLRHLGIKDQCYLLDFLFLDSPKPPHRTVGVTEAQESTERRARTCYRCVCTRILISLRPTMRYGFLGSTLYSSVVFHMDAIKLGLWWSILSCCPLAVEGLAQNVWKAGSIGVSQVILPWA